MMPTPPTPASRLPAERDSPRCLARLATPFQTIEVWENTIAGRFYTLDGRPMSAVADEYIYHECMTHPAALAHGMPKRALVLGGGDAGAARELLKHPSITTVSVAELDAQVVAMTRQYFPSFHQGAFDDPRVAVTIGDAADFVRAHIAHDVAPFDLAVFDLTPPDSPARGLFSVPFLQQLKSVLTRPGVVSVHLGSPDAEAERVRHVWRNLHAAFGWVAVMVADIPLYGGRWAMALAGDDPAGDPRAATPEHVAADLASRDLGALRYYNAARHHTLFAPHPELDALAPEPSKPLSE